MENIYNLFPNLINILSKIPDCKKYKYLILFINEKEFYMCTHLRTFTSGKNLELFGNSAFYRTALKKFV